MKKLKMFFKKKLYLPIKWIIEARAKAASMNPQDLTKLLEYTKELENCLVLAERENRKEDVIAYRARLEMIDWFLYVKTKGE